MRTVGTLTVVLTAGAVVSACASLGSDQLRGTSGAVAWEVVDARQTVAHDQREIRWDYTLVLKETAGRRIQFERIERLVYSRGGRWELSGSGQETSFQGTLGPNSELSLNLSDGMVVIGPWSPGFGDAHVPGGLQGMTVFYRFHGKDDTGQPLTVEVRVGLGPGVGKREPGQ